MNDIEFYKRLRNLFSKLKTDRRNIITYGTLKDIDFLHFEIMERLEEVEKYEKHRSSNI